VVVMGAKKFNLRKADWEEFETATESAFTEVLKGLEESDGGDTGKALVNVSWLYKVIAKTIHAAARHSIPRGRGGKKSGVRWWNDELSRLKKEKEEAQAAVRASGEKSLEEQERLVKIVAVKKEKFTSEQFKAQQSSWREFVSTLDARKEAREMFGVIKAMDGSKPKSKSSAAVRKPAGGPRPRKQDTLATTDREKAEVFAKVYAAVSRPTVNNKQAEKTTAREARRLVNAVKGEDDPEFVQFVMSELELALASLQDGKAPGHDEIANEMLKKLGPTGRKVLFRFVQESWR
jgi:hypothetical protein